MARRDSTARSAPGPAASSQPARDMLFTSMSSPSRIILAIENSNPSAAGPDGHGGWVGTGVAVGRHRAGSGSGSESLEVLAVEPIRQMGREADGLMPAISAAVERAGLSPGDIQRVAVSVGPGGYTAVRMACAAGAMIAHATESACCAVPSAWVVAAAACARVPGVRLGVALAGKDDSAHVTVFESPASWREIPRTAREIGVIRAGDVAALGLRVLLADRFLPGSMRDAAEAAGVELAGLEFDPVECLRLSTLLGECDPVELVPMYPREPDAVTLWRARHGAAKA